MAEQLDDGEFWLPSQFLTDDDDDILSDLGSGSVSGTGSDDDWVIQSKLSPVILSSSPQSILFGCEQVSNSSHGSPKDSENKQNDVNETLDLLNNAKMKLKSNESRSVGTGFFDCSNSVKRRFCPPSTTPQPRNAPLFQPPPFLSHPQFRYNAAWPPLTGQAQSQSQSQAQSKPVIGTGVFLPKPIVTPPASKKKSDGNVTKTKNKASQRRDSRSIKAKDDEIQLPSEWVY